MLNSLLTRIFGSRNERLLRQFQKNVGKINALEPEMEKLSDAELQHKTVEFRERRPRAPRSTSCCPRPSPSAARAAAACWACATTTCS